VCDHNTLQIDWARHRVICVACFETVDPVWAYSQGLDKISQLSGQNHSRSRVQKLRLMADESAHQPKRRLFF